MNSKQLIDTNVFIDLLKNNLDLTIVNIQFPDSFLCASFMTRVKLLSAYGLTKEEEEKIINLFSIIPIISYNKEIENYAIIIRRNSLLKIPDAFIAATALAQDAPLITNDYQLLKIKWPGLEVRSFLELNTTITTNNNNDKNDNDNDNDNAQKQSYFSKY
jgi:predicted nucleic acid-binding protein